MNMQIDKAIMEAYQQRWQLVDERLAEEQRQLSFEQRWQKLNSMLRMAVALGVDLHAQNDEEQVWKRWNLLRNHFLAEKSA